jgi:hypothetical protein
VANFLFMNKDARSALVEKATKDTTGTTDLETLGLPIGWPKGFHPKPEYIIGWLLTAFAATLGAPFWFDVLNKVMVIRSTVKPHEKSPEEDSEDRQKKEEATSATTPATTTPATVPRTSVSPPPSLGAPLDADSHLDGCDAMRTA